MPNIFGTAGVAAEMIKYVYVTHFNRINKCSHCQIYSCLNETWAVILTSLNEAFTHFFCQLPFLYWTSATVLLLVWIMHFTFLYFSNTILCSLFVKSTASRLVIGYMLQTGSRIHWEILHWHQVDNHLCVTTWAWLRFLWLVKP